MREGWQPQKLSKATTTIMGQAPAGKDCNKERNGTPFVKVGEFGGERPVIREWTTDPKKLARRTDVLLCVVGATCGKINLGEECAIGRSVAAIRPEEKMLNQIFLYYFLQGKVEQMRNASQGAAQTVISKAMIADIDIPLPPLPEQKRIVAILDEVFSGITQAVSNAEKNLKNARELFESYLNRVFTEKGEGWAEKSFEGLIESATIGLVRSKREQGKNLAYRYIKMNNITNDNRFDDTATTNVDASDKDLIKYQLLNGDFLFNTRNSYELVGKSCLYRSSLGKPVLYNNNIMRVRFRPEIDAAFAAYAFNSDEIVNQLELIKHGTTNVSAIYFKSLKGILLQYPALSEQNPIVEKLNLLRERTQQLETIYKQKLKSLAELKQSILQKAFTGELTADFIQQKVEE
jgi:type I restriction enzyme, S subunit